MNWTTLVSAEALAGWIGDPNLVLVDCRAALSDAGSGEQAWRNAHLPGAGYAHLDRDLSDHRKSACEGRHPMPEAVDFCAVLARLGITPEVQVVAYDAGDCAMAAARFWWLMRLLGHRRVAVLDGGWARWQASGLPLETEAPDIAPGYYAASFDSQAIVGVDTVANGLGQSPGWLIDARSAERFRGEVEPLDRVAGHIPGSVNRPWTDNLREGCFKSAEALRADFIELLAGHDPADAVLSCGSGVTACHNLLAMEYAGLHGARIFAPSWSGWISDPLRPIAISPADNHQK